MLRTIATAFRERPLLTRTVLLFCLMPVVVSLGYYPTTERVCMLLVLLAVVNPRIRSFVIDFAPFLLLLFTYDTLRNFADTLGTSEVHVTDMIRWETDLFGGTLPSHYLQTHLWGHFYTPVIDLFTNTLYLSHFITPLILAGALWRHHKPYYWAFAIGLVALSYAGFATYIAFPAAPPWWADYYGHLPNQPVTLDHFVVDAETMSRGPNPVAAMPSLHAAYPTFIALVSVAVWGKKALPVFLLPMGVIFATVYLGHHYVIDALAGATYALFFFSTVFLWFKKHKPSFALFHRHKLVENS